MVVDYPSRLPHLAILWEDGVTPSRAAGHTHTQMWANRMELFHNVGALALQSDCLVSQENDWDFSLHLLHITPIVVSHDQTATWVSGTYTTLMVGA